MTFRMNFHLEIVTPQRKVFSEEVSRLVVPTHRGAIGVLARHTPLFTVISEGEIKIQTDTKTYYLAIGGGFMEVTRDKISILVSRAYHAHELNEAEIRDAQESARRVIANRAKGDELVQAQAMLRRSILEMKVYHRRKLHASSAL